MSLSPDQRPFVRTSYWRHSTAMDPVSRPLAEWAYPYDANPYFITVTGLREASAEVQARAAKLWFFANLIRWDLGGPYFGFDEAHEPEASPGAGRFAGTSLIGRAMPGRALYGSPGRPIVAGLDEGTFAPPQVHATDALRGEFEGILKDEVIEALGLKLGDGWAWRGATPTKETRGANWPQARDPAIEALRQEMAEVRGALAALSPPKIGIGHNRPDEELSEADRQEALASLERIDEALEEADGIPIEALKAERRWVAKAMIASAKYAGRQLDIYVTEVNKGLAQKTAAAIAAGASAYLLVKFTLLGRLLEAVIGYQQTH